MRTVVDTQWLVVRPTMTQRSYVGFIQSLLQVGSNESTVDSFYNNSLVGEWFLLRL